MPILRSKLSEGRETDMSKKVIEQNRLDTADIKLDTLISYNSTLTQKFDRLNRFLVANNEIMNQLTETIENHLAMVKGIRDGIGKNNV